MHGSSPIKFAWLHYHVSTVAQNGQTKHLFYQGPFVFFCQFHAQLVVEGEQSATSLLDALKSYMLNLEPSLDQFLVRAHSLFPLSAKSGHIPSGFLHSLFQKHCNKYKKETKQNKTGEQIKTTQNNFDKKSPGIL